MNQGEQTVFFTLIISEISIQTCRISACRKTGDLSDRSELGPDGFNIILTLPKSREALSLDIKR